MDIHNLKSSDVLTLDQALEAAVLGYNVRAVDMQPGAFINYNFAGFRINFEGGSSSGWSRRSHDETVAWHVIDDPEPVKVDMPGVTTKDQAERIAKWGQGRLPAAPPVADVLVMGDGGKWGSVTPKPAPAPANVGKWGNGQPPKKDSWGRPI